MSGKLIVLEGLDGAGTTTQARRLEQRFGERMHFTREPSERAVGRLIREKLGEPGAAFDHRAMALLFAADRVDHYHGEIEPILDAGHHVVSDRYVMSSFAYQTGDRVAREFVAEINRHAPRAALTILLRVPVAIAELRRQERGGSVERYEHRLMQERVAALYDDEAARMRGAGERIVILDGARDVDAVFAEVLAAVESCIGGAGGSSSG